MSNCDLFKILSLSVKHHKKRVRKKNWRRVKSKIYKMNHEFKYIDISGNNDISPIHNYDFAALYPIKPLEISVCTVHNKICLKYYAPFEEY